MLKKIIIKVIIFVAIILTIIITMNPIFIIKTGHRDQMIEGLYDHTGNSYDVALIGSSHMNGGIDPNVLWNQYGITSYNYATGGQPIDVSYYLLKEILKNHKISAVVVDTYYLGLNAEYGDEEYVRYVIDNMKFSMNKLNAIINCTPFKDWINYIFPIFKYHDRWKELSSYDFNDNNSSTYYDKGFDAGTDKYGQDDTYNTSTSDKVNLPLKTEKYLNEIIDLSKEYNFKLILVNMPYDYNSTVKTTGWVGEPAKVANKVAEIAKKNNIEFINYCDNMSKISFDFKDDMNNEGHLNIWGAYKVTMDFGKILKENYKLTDHRNDSKYADWNTDYLKSQVYNIIEKKK